MQAVINKNIETLECIWNIPSTLGEGPLWVEHEQAVYWLDIVEKKVHRYSTFNQSKKSWQLSFELTSLAFREKGGFIGTVRDGFALVDFENDDYKMIQSLEEHLPENRFNDGKVDSKGNFWAGSMDENEKKESGSLYRLGAGGKVAHLDSDYIITNGPAFSPDGKTLYHNDTIKRLIYAYDIEEQDIKNKRVLYQFTDPEGYPDGLTVDVEGNLWQCSFAGARITKFSPQGEVLEVYEMPVPNITSCTFGGENLDTLYITTARYLMTDEDKQEYPLAGSLFSFKPGVKGLPTPLVQY
ncbi:SMP-30/gluconolactonase/LRE family protein [Flammeovirga sp. EKP202]|uniref:SMP-30/gluconolactonase/LRE family protein n=1 Tax=Flammeovirga sp. EKP202 TaxID=2770592 RepID=UPI00165FD088|nr:SMP-30/gluconolactonase/LRE family protein [Flammeovirga sp. EKP202]MBD0404112.1 SMP-30/gluconolactonase/LRE family protein [Flammeovirga sp. EKP202]